MRFNFEVIYNRIKFADVFKLFRGSSPRPIERFISSDKNDPYWIKIGDMPEIGYFVNTVKEHISIEGAKKSRAVYKGDMILSNSMSFGKPYILNIDGYIHDGWFVIRHYEEYFERDYLRYLLASPSIQKRYTQIAAGGVVLNISSDLVNSVVTFIPEKHEQSKISLFLSLIDKRIDTQNKIIEDYSSLKKSIIDNFFNELTNSSLGEHIIEITERNGYKNEYEVLSVSNKYGFIKQNEQFEDRIIASENKSNYKVVRKNTFAYNPARINVGSIACMHYLDIGIVSPMYLCFSTLKTLSPYYLEYYFLSKSFKLEMNKKLEGSVRMCLQIDALKKIKLYIPSLEIQNKFVNKLSCFDKKIQKEKDILSLYKKQKAYLLQNMFI